MRPGPKCDNGEMHTHFGSATHLASVFSSVLIAGTLWRIGWLWTLSYGARTKSKHLQGFAKAALFQY